VAVIDADSKLKRRVQAGNVFAKEEVETAQATYDSNIAEQQAAGAQVKAAQESLNAAQAAGAVVKTQLAGAAAQVKQAEAALHQAQIDLDHTRIVSPVDGTVVARQMDVGQTVAAGFQAPTLFVIAQDLAKMQVDTNVDEADIGRVQVGQDANFTVDAYPGVNFHGKVTEIRKAPINVQNVITYDAVVAVANPDLKLFPGMTANVKVLVDHRDDVVRVPNAALRFRPGAAQSPGQQRQSGSFKKQTARSQTVWVLGEDGKPAAVPVTLGISDGATTEVTGGNLKEGQQVIVGSNSEGASSSAAAQPFGGGASARKGGPRF
jgi:HlyD family secretion protein